MLFEIVKSLSNRPFPGFLLCVRIVQGGVERKGLYNSVSNGYQATFKISDIDLSSDIWTSGRIWLINSRPTRMYLLQIILH
ncbi:hypothetical protein AFLA_008721 [Aspergillus flavus NRRL3357]|nr:hypothetical protein AFLA_008721 [Aspergillus flavus NRRL3357]